MPISFNWDATPFNWENYPYEWQETPSGFRRGNLTNSVPNPIQFDKNRSEGRRLDNRALHLRRDVDTLKNFNVSIKDIDETVFKHLNKMQLTVIDAGNRIKVPISYASPEKWKSIHNDGFQRDNNGKIILPALVFYRQSSETDKAYQTFNKYLRTSVIKLYSQKNQYTRFGALNGANSPINEVYNVVFPDHMNFNYKFMVWTEYIEQMNAIIERINFETNDYWGDSSGFRFRTYVDSYAHTTEVENEKDRLVRTEFDLTLRGYLLPEQYAPGLDGFKSTTEKSLTKKKVIMGMEVVGTGWKPEVDKNINDRWRSQKFPNITLEDELTLNGLSTSVVKIEDLEAIRSSIRIIQNSIQIGWHLPAPITSDDPGQEGWQSYDNDYYYLYTCGFWRRVPLVLFNRFGQ
jgi:hypothetical protein